MEGWGRGVGASYQRYKDLLSSVFNQKCSRIPAQQTAARPGALGSLRSLLLTFTPQPCSVSAGFRPLAQVCGQMPRQVNVG